MSTQPTTKKVTKRQGFQMPDTYVIIFFVVLLAALFTYVIPIGKFDVLYRVYDADSKKIVEIADGEKKDFQINGKNYTVDATGARTLVIEAGKEDPLGSIRKNRASAVEVKDGDKLSFKVVQQYGDYRSTGDKKGIKLFEKEGGVGFLNYAFEGLVKGDKWGSAVGVIAFILIVGGAFGIILKTGAVEAGVLSVISRTKGYEIAIIPILFFLFSLGGAVFGMGEEAIPFAMIVVPMVIAMGYDAIVGIMITYGATQIGFATSWMNPFSVAIAQGIAGVTPLSGSAFRIAMFVIFTAVGVGFTWLYAVKIKKDPFKSVAYESDAYYRKDFKMDNIKSIKFSAGHALVLITILLGIIWVIWGVKEYGYYIPELATIFFTMGLVAGIIGVIFRLNNMNVNDIAVSFRDGAKDLVGAAMVVGMAQGIVLVLGHDSAASDSVLNTILHGMSGLLGGLPVMLSAWFMYAFQSIFNFFVVSGSGQAALTMPLMAPLADLIGVSKQVAVLAFQLGDGLTNLIVPTSGCLMGVLGVARLDWGKWAKFQIKFQGILILLSTIFVVVGVLIGF
jgi:uncharacterized ion transporter superfamily protein YfcC